MGLRAAPPERLLQESAATAAWHGGLAAPTCSFSGHTQSFGRLGYTSRERRRRLAAATTRVGLGLQTPMGHGHVMVRATMKQGQASARLVPTARTAVAHAASPLRHPSRRFLLDAHARTQGTAIVAELQSQMGFVAAWHIQIFLIGSSATRWVGLQAVRRLIICPRKTIQSPLRLSAHSLHELHRHCHHRHCS